MQSRFLVHLAFPHPVCYESNWPSTQVFPDSGEKLHCALRFLRRNEKLLRNERIGAAPFQLAMQEPTNSPVKKMFSPDSPVLQKRIGGKVRLIEWLNKREEAYPCLMSISEHEGQVNAIACSPDGIRMATGGSDNAIKICRIATGELETTLHGHTHWVNCVVFSASGELLVSGSVDMTVRIWDVERGEEKYLPLTGHNGPVNCVAISPDGSLVTSAGTDKVIRVWDLKAPVQKILDQGMRLQDALVRSKSCCGIFACFCPRGQKKIPEDQILNHPSRIAGSEKDVRSVSRVELRGVLKGHTSWVNACAINIDGSTMISGSNDEIKFWYLSNMSDQGTVYGHDGNVNTVGFTMDGETALSGGSDGLIKLWDLTEGCFEKGSFVGHMQSVTSLAVANDGDFIVSGSSDKQIKMWQLSTMQEVGTMVSFAPTSPFFHHDLR